MPDAEGLRRTGRLFERILVPLDGSVAAESVLQHIGPLRASGSPLHLVRVVPGTETNPPAPRLALDLLEAESYLAYVAACAGDGSEFEVRRGDAADAILDCAAVLRPDLIALAPRTGPRDGHAEIGSTAGALLLRAPCPVFVLGTGNSPAAARMSRILVPLDGSAESEEALEPARRIAGAAGASLLLLHVVETLWAAGDSAMAARQEQEARATRDRLDALARALRQEDLEARSLLLGGDPAGTIRAQLARRQIDLVCLATAARGALGRMVFGSVAHKLIGNLPVAVIAVRRSR